MKNLLPKAAVLPFLGIFAAASSALAASATWTGAGGNGDWATAGNWLPSVPGVATGTTNTDTATFNNNVNTTITVDPARSLSSLRFNASAGSFTFNSGTLVLTAAGGSGATNSLLLDSGATNQTVNSNIMAFRTSAGSANITFANNSTSGTLTVNGNVTGIPTAGATTVLNLSGAGVIALNGAVSNGTGGSLSVVKSGIGTTVLAGANTYTGNTDVFSGGLTLNFAAAGAPVSNIVSNSSALRMGSFSPSNPVAPVFITLAGKADTANTQTFNNLSFGAGAAHIALTTSGTGTMVLNTGSFASANRSSGATLDITTQAGTAVVTTGTGANSGGNGNNGVVAQAITLNGTTFATNVSGTLVGFTGYVANTGTSLGTGNQIVDMSGGNTSLTGITQTSIGGLRFNNAVATSINLDPGKTLTVGGANTGAILVTSNVGANLSSINSGVLKGINSRDLIILQNNTAGDLAISSAITNVQTTGGQLTKSGAGTVILSGKNTYGGDNFINEGKVIVTSDAIAGSSKTATSGSGSAVLSGVDTTGLFIGQRVTGSPLTGSTAFYIVAIDSGAGTVTLNGNATAAGSSSFNFSDAGGLGISGTTTGVTISNGATVQIGNGGTTGSLYAPQGILNNGTVALNRSDSFTFSNTMTGAGSLVHMGTGTTTLLGTHSYSGVTAVNAGTLLLNGTALNSAANVNSGGRFGGSGTIGSIVLNAGGAVTPGNSIGTLNTNNGSLLWNGENTIGLTQMKFELDTLSNGADLLNLGTGMLDQGTGDVFAFDFQGTGGAGFTYTLITFGSTDFTLDDFTYTNLGSGLSGEFVLNANNLQFVVSAIPEPSVAMLLIGAGAFAFGCSRRR